MGCKCDPGYGGLCEFCQSCAAGAADAIKKNFAPDFVRRNCVPVPQLPAPDPRTTLCFDCGRSDEDGHDAGCRQDPRELPSPRSHDSYVRKRTPMFRGLKRYFPDALMAVSRLSFKGHEKHSPGQPLENMHHCRPKSSDHGDCIERHQTTYDSIDPENGEYHAVAVAWRALAQLQQLLESEGLAERAPGSYSLTCNACNAAMKKEFSK